MNKIIKIDDIEIEQDGQGRYSLNDLHKAAGGAKRHQPSDFLGTQQTKDLITEIERNAQTIDNSQTGYSRIEQNQALSVIKGGNNSGSFGCRELVYAYAMWISAAFHLKVIHTFDAAVSGRINAPLTPGEMLMASAQAMIAMERRQAANEQDIQRIESKVEVLAESRVWDHCPQNCETISKIRVRMNERYGLPQWVIDTIMWRLPLSPKPHGMVRNQREEAKGSQYEVYAVADITRIFAQFVSECEQESPMRASHRDIDRSFQLVPSGKKPKKLKAHAVAESEAV